jgi:hypothetical protein
MLVVDLLVSSVMAVTINSDEVVSPHKEANERHNYSLGKVRISGSTDYCCDV